MYMFTANNENESYYDTSSNDNIEALIEFKKNQSVSDPLSLYISENQSSDMNNNTSNKQEENTMSAAMIGTIGFYKKIISPLLPPACRFVPTCSTYGVQAIQQYGPTKGCILIAWRILRCSPIGGKGYDPPKWPPVSYTYSSY
jgi:uncharacterized protein